MERKKPKNLLEFFEFYYEDFKPLYNRLQIRGKPPLEMLFEINAAFDHISRYWHYQDSEASAVDFACRHLKRGSFDAFKILLLETMDEYRELLNIDTSIIDNGEFDGSLKKLIANIESLALQAKMKEGDNRNENNWNEAYDLWSDVYLKCLEFDEKFYRNEKVKWARKKQFKLETKLKWRLRIEGFMVGILASLAAAGIVYLVSCIANQG